MREAARRGILIGLIFALAPALSSAGEPQQLEWLLGGWQRESARGTVHESFLDWPS